MPLIPNPRLQFQILFEESSFLAIDKPAGLPVYPLKEIETQTVANGLIAMRPELAEVGPPLQAGLVHRLDNDTSGILIVAKNAQAYEEFKKIWNSDQVTKTYQALVLGKPRVGEVITTPIAHHPSRKNKMRVCETEELAQKYKARPAITKIVNVGAPLAAPSPCPGRGNPAPTEVTVQITTGVRHQIRVHLASIGHPLAGDKLYQNPQKRKEDTLGLKTFSLRLVRVELIHPATSKKIMIECAPTILYAPALWPQDCR